MAESAVTLTGEEGFSLISNEKLVSLYANLLKCRIALKRAAAEERRNKSLAGVLRGSEAGTVAVTIDLGPEDIVCAADHTLLTGFLNGAPVESILHSFSRNGRSGVAAAMNAKGNTTKRNGARQPVPHQEPMHAVIGAALANKTEKNGKIAVIFDNAAEGQAWEQAIEIAAAHGLPIIFVSQLAGKTDSAVKKRSAGRSKAGNYEKPFFPSINVDGHDVVAVYRVANEAISRARKGRGPTLIDCRPFLVDSPQASNGNGGGHRHSQDAVANMENYLSNKGLFSRKLKAEIFASASRELGN